MELPLGWSTDLAVLRLGDATFAHRDDHVVVRSPQNPTYYWGNFVLVTDPAASDDPDRWVSVFAAEFPGAAHCAIGLVSSPSDDGPWQGRDLVIERSDVLVARTPLRSSPCPEGYLVRPLRTAADWDASTALRCREAPGQEEFERRTTVTRAAMAAHSQVTWYGAFAGEVLAAELGIVPIADGVARYQSVLTDAEHRRRGLVSHLLAVADADARAAGADRTVIIADQGSAAARLYRAAGFTPDSVAVQAYRGP